MSLQIVELHFDRDIDFDLAAIRDRSQELLGDIIAIGQTEGEPGILIHQSHQVAYTEGLLPAQTALLPKQGRADTGLYQKEIQQSWRCQNAQALLERSAHQILITELICMGLEPLVRVQLFHAVLQAAIELTAPIAIVCKHTQQVIDPDDYLEACEQPPYLRPGALNVRFFTLTDTDGDMLMDTLGLHAVGLLDFQCHYRRLEPSQVADHLYGVAVYTVENGPVIENGHTIAGIDGDSKWRCQIENALVPPEREVIDINPGTPFAAGNRTGE